MKNTRNKLIFISSDFLEKVKNLDIRWLTSFPALIVVTIMILVGNLNVHASEKIESLLVALIFLAASLISLVVIIRKEYPFFRTIKGKPAVLLGIIGLLISCPLTFAMFAGIILDTFQK